MWQLGRSFGPPIGPRPCLLPVVVCTWGMGLHGPIQVQNPCGTHSGISKHVGRPAQPLSQRRVLPCPGWWVCCFHKSHTAPCGSLFIQIIPTFFRISNHFAFIQSVCQVHDIDWYIVWYIVVFVYSSVDLTSLRRVARWRISHAYRPGTKANQRSQIKSYLSFCISHGLEYRNPSVDTLCVYAEYLAHKLTSPKSVKNYLGAVQLYHNYIGLEAPNLSHLDIL